MIVRFDHIQKRYQSPDGEVEALADVDFTVEEGAFVSVVGPSGCGKSTLFNILVGLEQPTAGRVLLDGQPVEPGSAVGYMPQRDQLFPWRTIWGNVVLGLEIHHQKDRTHLERVRELLRRYGLEEFSGKLPAQLSGGMRQRCALIRTLATDPGLLLLDEPFSALDSQTRLTVAEDMQTIIRREGKTALLVTHDISEAVSLSDRVVVLTARPAKVKTVHSLGQLEGLTPTQRRSHPDFPGLVERIRKEMELGV